MHLVFFTLSLCFTPPVFLALVSWADNHKRRFCHLSCRLCSTALKIGAKPACCALRHSAFTQFKNNIDTFRVNVEKMGKASFKCGRTEKRWFWILNLRHLHNSAFAQADLFCTIKNLTFARTESFPSRFPTKNFCLRRSVCFEGVGLNTPHLAGTKRPHLQLAWPVCKASGSCPRTHLAPSHWPPTAEWQLRREGDERKREQMEI